MIILVLPEQRTVHNPGMLAATIQVGNERLSCGTSIAANQPSRQLALQDASVLADKRSRIGVAEVATLSVHARS